MVSHSLNGDATRRGLVMRIDNVPNFWVPESMRSRFEREDTLAGVLGLPAWEMFVWHNWRRIVMWIGLFYLLILVVLANLDVDGVNLSVPSTVSSLDCGAHCRGSLPPT